MNKQRETIFRFKQFHIKNEISAMKVGTDGVLLGAWANISSDSKILDIGSGTGLISLMAAQRSEAQIIGVEIDTPAYIESLENIQASPWNNRITIINDDINNIVESLLNVSHIISNPPFFENGIVAPDTSRATARHCNTLGFDRLIHISSKVLPMNGKLSFVSPFENKENIIYSASLNKMYISRYTEVYSNPKKKHPIRILWELTKQEERTDTSHIYIRDCNNQYTSEYINLTKDFYLNF